MKTSRNASKKSDNLGIKKGKNNMKAKLKQNRPKSRKEKRKELKEAKKKRQQQHVVNKLARGKTKQEEGIAPASGTPVKNTGKMQDKKEINEGTEAQKIPCKLMGKKVRTNRSKEENNQGPTQSVKVEKHRLEKEMQVQRLKQLKIANREEDKNIRRLAKQLKLNRRKSKTIPKAFTTEGLDYLLEVCDPEKLQALSKDQTLQESSGSEFEDDFAEVTGRPKTIAQTRPLSCSESSDGSEDTSDEEIGIDNELLEEGSEDEEMDFGLDSEQSDMEQQLQEEVKPSSKNSSKSVTFKDDVNSIEKIKITSKNEVEHKIISAKKLKSKKGKKREKIELVREDSHEAEEPLSDTDDEDSFCSEGEEGHGSDQEEEKDSQHWEDIYGRKRDKKGNIVLETAGRYVPPALRAGASTDSAKLLRLRRQMQGLLNRVAESNMGGVSSQLEEAITAQSRGDASEVLGQLLLAALVLPHAVTPTKLAAEHAMLLAMLHAHIGAEIGATFLQTVVTTFDQSYSKSQDIENKTLNNLLLILCFMYCFKIFHSVLIFDILKKLSQEFSEKDVELILLVLKNVGPTLRKDDPTALKEIILQLQRQATDATQHKENTRVRFMLDVLLAIKNNNMSRIPDYDSELVEHLRKVLRGLLRQGAQVSELKISLEDLLLAEERGRWWVVGSAWQGTGPGVASSDQQQATSEHNFSHKLLELARKQRMNTDVRRTIFCILMSAEDFLDAFEKLLRLGLKGQQEREISYVLLDCCLQEKSFNPYYGHLSQKFCDFDRKYRMSLQCSIWDKIKELPNLAPTQLRNLASLVSHLILGTGLTLSVLKVIQFADLEKVSVKFVRQVLLGLLLSADEEVCADAFSRVPPTPQLALFRESLCMFLHRYVLRNQHQLPAGGDAELLTARAGLAVRVLTTADSKVTL